MKKAIIILTILATLLCVAGSAHADHFEIKGHVYNGTGNAVQGTNITVETWNETNQFVNITVANSTADGSFNLTGLQKNFSHTFKILIRKETTNGSGEYEYVGPIMPRLRYTNVLSTLSNLSIYMKKAVTFNITLCINNTTAAGVGGLPCNTTGTDADTKGLTFKYLVQDTKFGLSLYETDTNNTEGDWRLSNNTTGDNESGATFPNIVLPVDRNYSTTVTPVKVSHSFPGDFGFTYTNISYATQTVAGTNASSYMFFTLMDDTSNNTIEAVGSFISVAGNVSIASANASDVQLPLGAVTEEPMFQNLTVMVFSTSYLERGGGDTAAHPGSNLSIYFDNKYTADLNATNISSLLAYNLSGLYNNSAVGVGDLYANITNLTSEWEKASGHAHFNVTLPAPYESGGVGNSSYILFITAKNNTSGSYYGAFRNVTVSGGAHLKNINVTLYPLVGSEQSLTRYTTAGTGFNTTTKLMQFNLTDGTNSPTSAVVHVEVNYSNYTNMSEGPQSVSPFTWVIPISGDGNDASFKIPMISAPIARLSVYSQDPRFAPYTTTQLTELNLTGSLVNITLGAWDAKTINGTAFGDRNVTIFRSNTTCDVPPVMNETIATDGILALQECQLITEFEGGTLIPLELAFAGNNVSMLVRDDTTNVSAMFLNLDLASGTVPDVLFDVEKSEPGGTDAVDGGRNNSLLDQWRFGSSAPKNLYDSVLIGVPYNDSKFSDNWSGVGAGGADPSNFFNVTLELLYDRDWTQIWNTSNVSGTGNVPTAYLDAFNVTNYTGYVFAGINASNVSRNLTASLAFTDVVNDMVWAKVPHFSGFAMRVEAIDNSSLEVENVTPPSASGISPTISVTFNEKTQVGTGTDGVNNKTFFLNKSGTGGVVPIAGVTSNDNKTWTITLETNVSKLAYGTDYNVTIRNTITDETGNNTLGAGTYTWQFTTVGAGGDEAGAAGGGGGSGSGGSLAAPEALENYFEEVVDADSGEVVEEAAVQLVQGDVMGVTHGSDSHTINVAEVGSSWVVVNIASTPTSYTLSVGKPKYVDLNDDSKNDLKLTLNSIKNGIADITIQKLEDGFVAAEGTTATPSTPITTPISEPGDEPSAPTEGTTTVPEMQDIPSWAYWLILIVAVVAGIAYWFSKKK